jgi:hypothetical protein
MVWLLSVRGADMARISYRRRFALLRAHEGCCAYCKEVMPFRDTVVDHILPQHLRVNRSAWRELLRRYNLGDDFSLDDVENLLPVHQACNSLKGGRVFDPARAHFFLEIARAKAPHVRREEDRISSDLKADRLLAKLATGLETGLLPVGAVQALIQHPKMPPAEEHDTYDPIIVTFGLAVEDLIGRADLPDSVPLEYPHLCDWLEEDLKSRLSVALSCTMFVTEESARNGETLSVRVALVRPDLEQLRTLEGSWWEILEIAYFSEIYDEPGDRVGFAPAGLSGHM